MSTARRGRLNMGTQNYLWCFILSVSLCTLMALERRNTTTATAESHVNVSRSTNNNNSTGPAANRSNASVAEPNTQGAHSLLVTTSLSPSVTRMVDGEGRMNTTAEWEGSTLQSPGSAAVSPAFPTAEIRESGSGEVPTAPSMSTETSTASSPPLSSATTSHSSSSSSSPEGSSAVPPSPQQSSTTEPPLATTSQPPTALVLSSPSSTAAIASAQLSAGTAEAMTQAPTTSKPVASTSSTSPASGTTEARLSPTLGSSKETLTPQLASTALTQGQPTLEVTATSSPVGSPSPSVTTASVGSSATIPPGEGESSTINQGIRTTTDPSAETSHSLPATSLVSTTRMVSEEGSTDTTPTPPVWEGDSLGTSPGNGAVSPAFPTTGPGTTTAPSTGTESGTASSLAFSSAVTSHSSSSSSSSPEGSSAVPPSPQQSSTSSTTTETPLATTSQPPTALVLSSPSSTAAITGNESEPMMNSPAPITPSTSPVPSTSGTSSMGSSAVPPSPQHSSTSSTTEPPLATTSQPPTALVFSTAGVTGVESHTVTAEEVTASPAPSTASTHPVASASITSPASESTAASPSSTPGSSTETRAPGHSPTGPTQGQPTGEVTATSSPTGSPSPSTSTASAGSSATIPPGEGENSTTTQGIRTTHTSHSLPSTSLATPSTTNLSASTSVNPPSTGTCLAVSIKVENVTEEEIQLSWTSSSTGSLYNISVREGKEIYATSTNETETVLKNLLPGHVYTISVSSCAGNNPASVTVRTDPDSCFRRTEFCLSQSTGCSDLKGIVCSNNQAFACRVWLKNKIFNSTLYNSASEGYRAMSESFKTTVVEAMHAELGNDHSDILVLGFRPGSVAVDFLFLVPKEEATDVDDIQTRLTKVLRSKFGNQTKVQFPARPVQSSTDNISSWRAAVIVLGVLLGVALVLILLAILFYICVRRRSGMEFSTLYT